MNIIVQIDELILHGVAPAAADVGDALKRELARLLTERGVPRTLARSGATGAIDGGTVHLREGARASHIGHQLASAVNGSLEGE